MGRRKYSEEQIIRILGESDAGKKTSDLCREYNISTPTFYQWKAKYGGMGVSEAKRLRALEEENRKLKKLVADQALQLMVTKEVLEKKF